MSKKNFLMWMKFIENILSCSWNHTHCSHSLTHDITSFEAKEKTFPWRRWAQGNDEAYGGDGVRERM
jgi:hypothetical protein